MGFKFRDAYNLLKKIQPPVGNQWTKLKKAAFTPPPTPIKMAPKQPRQPLQKIPPLNRQYKKKIY